MKEETEVRRYLIPAKINLLKKKTMHLPILSLHGDTTTARTIKNKLPISNHKSKEKRSISQILNIIECPQPTQNVFLRRGKQKKQSLFDFRDRTNQSQLTIRRKKKPDDLFKSLKMQVEEAIQRLVEVKKNIPKIKSLRAYIERQSALKDSLREKAKCSQRRYKTLQGEELTTTKVTIEPMSCQRKPFSYQGLESSLLKKEYLKFGSLQTKLNVKRQLRRNNKSEQHALDKKEEYLSGWNPLTIRYKSWQEDTTEAPVPLECEYFQS